MKELEETLFNSDCLYSKEHTWARKENGKIVVGISDYAQNQLGEIIFVELPSIDDVFEQDDEFGFVESAKSVSDLYIPLSGKISEVNSTLEDQPEIINNDPFGEGWMIKITPDNEQEMDSLLSADEYKKQIGA